MRVSSAESREAWDLLEALEPTERSLRVREALGIDTPSGHPLYAIDSSGNRHVLVPVPSGTRIRDDRRSAGVHLLAHKLIDRGAERLFVDVVCLKPHLFEPFALVVGEMLEQIGDSGDRPDLVCGQVLARWRELLEKEPSRQIGQETIRGVFGELWHLREIVRGDPDGLRYWMGPTGARHDFSTGTVALEVKTTAARAGRVFEIHGHDQLEPPPCGRLYLAMMRVEQVPSGGETLRDLVDSIIDLGADRHFLLALMAQAGINPADLEQCGSVSFRVIEQRIYEVDDGFPRITSASFVGGALPAGVIRLAYQIDLSGEPPFPLDEAAVSAVYAEFSRGTTA